MRTKRKFSAELKAKIALSVIDGSKTVLEVGREYDIAPNLIHRWKDQFVSQASGVFVTKIEDREEKRKIKHYEHVIAKLTTQNDFLDKVLTTLK